MKYSQDQVALAREALGVVKAFIPSLQTRVLLVIFGLVASLLGLAATADVKFTLTKVFDGAAVALSYENKAQTAIFLGAAGVVLAIGVWLFLRVQSGSIPRSSKLAELEDWYEKRGGRDSVCEKFREVHGVYVTPAELDYLMQRPETSLRALHLRNAYAHVAFHGEDGYLPKNHAVPYRLLANIFLLMFVLTTVIAVFFFELLAASLVLGYLPEAAKLVVGLIALGAVAWSAIRAYAACNSTLTIHAISQSDSRAGIDVSVAGECDKTNTSVSARIPYSSKDAVRVSPQSARVAEEPTTA